MNASNAVYNQIWRETRHTKGLASYLININKSSINQALSSNQPINSLGDLPAYSAIEQQHLHAGDSVWEKIQHKQRGNT